MVYQRREFAKFPVDDDVEVEQSMQRSIFEQYELPHANSKVFDEGDMPMPGKFKKCKTQKHSLKDIIYQSKS